MPPRRVPHSVWSWPQVQADLRAAGYELVAGLDEAGCGALAGPVVAGAVLAPLDADLRGLRDSKLLSPTQRDTLYERLLGLGLPCAVGLAYAEEVDRLNIFHAARLAMRRALDQLDPRPQFVLMDGHLPPDFGVPCRALVKGDRDCPLISAASILAKVHRDRIMLHLAQLFPQYGFELHKGYATPEHALALEQYGPCEVHRRTYAPVRGNHQESLPF